jgi:hypothetical protein
MWLTSQAPASTLVQTCAVFTCNALPHFDSCNASTSWIKEVIKFHILQIKDATTPQEEEEEFSHDIFKVFTTEKKKHSAKSSKVPELVTPLLAIPMPTTSSSTQRNALAVPSSTAPAPANDSNPSRSSSQY